MPGKEHGLKVTSKRQVTIPQSVRGRADPGRGAALVTRLRGRGSARLSTDQILALTRGRR
jgi:bifunctional DNA-binding transcriptional regulator/antitoxin component of YhaV-PrlF toxin-antitoxin module